MRKLKKPKLVSPKPSDETLKDTLLTIPPLILGDQVQSMNFLKTSEIKFEAKKSESDQNGVDDGKILFTTNNDKEASESVGRKKRKLEKNGDSNEEYSDEDNSSNESKDGDDLEDFDEGEIKSSDSD